MGHGRSRVLLEKYEPRTHLDHMPLIQNAAGIVSAGMQAIATIVYPLVTAQAASFQPAKWLGGLKRGASSGMHAENHLSAAGMEWSRLIVDVAKHRDRAAFRQLFEHFAPRLKTYMQRSGANETGAEELAQEAMLTVWRKAEFFDPASAGASAWIFAIARNLRIDAFRRDRRGGLREVREIEAEFQIDPSPLPDASVAATQSEALVRSALEELSADQMRVIELSFFEERAHADIAGILGIPLGTVKSRLRLAMNRLRGLLGDLS